MCFTLAIILYYSQEGGGHVTTRINEPMLRLTLKFRIPTGIGYCYSYLLTV